VKRFLDKFEIEFFFATLWNGNYKKFNITPNLMFIKDTQLKNFKTEDWDGIITYELWFDWFNFESGIHFSIKE